MRATSKFSGDPKTKLVSIEKFFKNNGYLIDVSKGKIWHDLTTPREGWDYYKFDETFFIHIVFGNYFDTYGLNIKEIEVAYRDGQIEYEILDEVLKCLKSNKKSKTNDKRIDNITNIMQNIPKFQLKKQPSVKPYESYLIHTKYKVENEELMNKYLIIDIKTNGFRKVNDDLLLITIYDPTTGICYNRYLPHEMQPLVITGFINGITDDLLCSETHITQDEFNWLCDFFHVKDRKLLFRSNNEYFINYCKRHSIVGFEILKNNIEDNIEVRIMGIPYVTGEKKKKSLYNLLGITEINEINASYKYCILEWKLFEIFKTDPLFIIDNSLYRYNPNFIVPLFSKKYSFLSKYAKIKVPNNIDGIVKEEFKITIPQNILKDICEFDSDIIMPALEEALNMQLNAQKQDNKDFLLSNIQKLEYIGTLSGGVNKSQDDESFSLNEFVKSNAEDISFVKQKIINYLMPLTNYLKNAVFLNDNVLSQELVISKDGKVFSLCDLSDDKNVLIIKNGNYLLDDNDTIPFNITKQLYYQSNGRKTYLLLINIDKCYDLEEHRKVFNEFSIYLYNVGLFKYKIVKDKRERILDEQEILVLKQVINDPKISRKNLAIKTGLSEYEINDILLGLSVLKYIRKIAPNSKWKILRSASDIKTIFLESRKEYHRIN